MRSGLQRTGRGRRLGFQGAHQDGQREHVPDVEQFTAGRAGGGFSYQFRVFHQTLQCSRFQETA